MTSELIKNRVKYRFFDKTFETINHYYTHKDLKAPPCPVKVVRDNYVKVVKAMGGRGLLVLRQVHGAGVVIATSPTEYGLEPEADAVVTNVPGLVLGIQTADCVPVLFSCKSGSVIGAAHCSWKSAKLDIINEVLGKMGELGALEVVATIGPSIQQESYEVDQAYHDDFIAEDNCNAVFFKKGRESHYLFDLPGYVERKLNLAGVIEVGKHKDDTYSIKDKYYSWRRCCHEGTPYQGNLLSTVMIVV